MEKDMMKTSDRTLYMKTMVAGVGYHEIDEVGYLLHEGSKVQLLRERDNEYDSNAVSVIYYNEEAASCFDELPITLGYVPRKQNLAIAKLMDMGWGDLFDCEISHYDDGNTKNYGLEVAIYIKQKNRKSLFRPLSLDEIDEEELQNLQEYITLHDWYPMRIGGFPIDFRHLPQKQDEIVLMYTDEEASISTLYLMKVVAENDEESKQYIQDINEVYCHDDCVQYILKCEFEPIKMPSSKLKFLNKEHMEHWNNLFELPDYMSYRLLSFFSKEAAKEREAQEHEEVIRTATIADLEEISQLEGLGFPPAEAASRDAFKWRLLAYPNHFWVLEQGGKILSFINGPVTQEKDLTDEMYDDPNFCDDKGGWQMVFGVVTHPKHQHQGLASRLMQRFIEEAKIERRKGIVLTCKEEKITFYEQFGFRNEGISSSVHGGVTWYQMRLIF